MEVLALVLMVLFLALAPIVLSVIAIVTARGTRREFRKLQERVAQVSMTAGERTSGTTPETSPDSASPIPSKPVQPAPPPPQPVEPTKKPAVAEAPEPDAAAPIPAPGKPPEPVTRVPHPQPQPSSDTTPPTRPPRSFEEFIGAKALVVIGAIALVLAALFLVKHFHDRGILDHRARVLLGALFGCGLIAGSEWVARRAAGVAQGMAAAGVGALYGATWAAVNVYHLIGPVSGVLCIGAVTAVAVFLSLRRGPFVALLGLVGGFLTPRFIAPDFELIQMLAYLFLLQIGMVGVTRRRGWWVLSALTLLGVIAWVLILLALEFRPADGPWMGLFLLGSVASFVLAAPRSESSVAQRAQRTVAGAAAAASLLLMAIVAGVAEFTLVQWAYMGILAGGCMLLARFDSRYEWLAWLGTGASVALLAVYGFPFHPRHDPPDPYARFLYLCLAFGGLHAGGAYAALWRARRPAMWAALSVVATLALLLVAYVEHDSRALKWQWAGGGAGLATLFAVSALPVLARRSTMTQGDATLATLLVGSVALLASAVPMALEEDRWTLAWALLVPACVFIERRLQVAALGQVGAALAVAILVRLLINPQLTDYDLGTAPVFNSLLYLYGVPLLALLGAAAIYRRDHSPGDHGLPVEDTTSAVLFLEAGAILLWLGLITVQVRHGFHGEDLTKSSFPLRELGTHTLLWLGSTLGLGMLGRVWSSRAVHMAFPAVGVLAMAGAVIGPGLVANPLLGAEPVGSTPVFNELCVWYALPAVLVLTLATAWRRCGLGPLANGAAIVGLVLLFLFVTLEVRQGFHGNYLNANAEPISWELYAYSLAWILFGLVLMAVGVVRRGVVTRWASLVVLLATTGKVFLYDVKELDDLYRVFSFLCLGAALMGLGYVYQRYVFGAPQVATTDA